jgi:very-short-patch-repair endonuclease
MVQIELRRRNIPFHFSVILGNFQFDFGNKERRVLLEVQGDYWHGNPTIFGEGKRPLNNVQREKIEKDSKKEEFCKKNNIHLFKIWESDILNKNFSVLDSLEKIIAESEHLDSI